MTRGPNAVMRPSDATTAQIIFKLSGLSYHELGRRSGLSHTHCRRVLRGTNPVTEPVAAKLAVGLNVPVDVLFPIREGASRAA